jgi:hypothetical protein
MPYNPHNMASNPFSTVLFFAATKDQHYNIYILNKKLLLGDMRR